MTDWTDRRLVTDAQAVLRIVSGKWTLLILSILRPGPRRHNALRREIDSGIKPKVFDETLRRMINQGLIERNAVSGASPPAVYYQLSPFGRSLTEILAGVLDWTDGNRAIVCEWRRSGRN